MEGRHDRSDHRRVVRRALRLPVAGVRPGAPPDADAHADALPGRPQRPARRLLDRHHVRGRAAVAQDWETFSSELGVSVPATQMTVQAIPEHVDPPLHRVYKRLINAYFTPAAVAPYEEPTRALVTGLIDGFIEAGRCDFLTEFARPFPGLAFFDLVLNAPSDEVAELNDLATTASMPNNPEAAASAGRRCTKWIAEFVEQRRRPAAPRRRRRRHPARRDRGPADHRRRDPRHDPALDPRRARDHGRRARALHDPVLPGAARSRRCSAESPSSFPTAVEELLRLEGPFIAIGRTARHDAEIGGHPIKEGEKVLIYWASANRDEAEFPDADTFDLDRAVEPAHRLRRRPAPLRRLEPRPPEPAASPCTRWCSGWTTSGAPGGRGERCRSTRRSTARP